MTDEDDRLRSLRRHSSYSSSVRNLLNSRAAESAIDGVRKGSAAIKHLFDVKHQEGDPLDLDTYYKSRQRRRTVLGDDITSSLAKGGILTSPSISSLTQKVDYSSSAPARRSLHVTLSPGEEYENYQKVYAATSTLEVNAIQEETEDEVEGAGVDKNTIETFQHSLGEASSKGDSSQRAESDTKDNDSVRQPDRAARMTGIAPGLQHVHSRLGKRHDAKLHTHLATRKKPERLMFSPLGRFRLVWDVLSIGFIFYNAIALPFDASFDTSAWSKSAIETCVDIFFMFDIFITFNTAAEIGGSLRYSRKEAARTYLTSWFIVDLTAALPYDLFFSDQDVEDSSSSYTLLQTLRLLRLVRLLRLFRVSRILRRIQNTIFIRSTLSSLLKYCLMVMFIAHWFSCIFHAIAVSSTYEKNWVTEQRLQEPNANKWDRYVAALYFSVMTLATIGFGDVAGTNPDERFFCIFAMIVGGGVFAYGITNIVELVSSLTIHETRFRQKMDEVNEYMTARELPMRLRMEIREFYHNTRLSRESKLNAEQRILNDLSSKLRSKIALSINDQFLRKFKFFAGSDPDFLMELALNMRMIHFAPLEDVIVEGEVGYEMFFIFRGAVEVIRGGRQLGIMGENQYFGELAILNDDNRRTATVRTICFCELRLLSRTRFLDALALFPAMQAKMEELAAQRNKQKSPRPRLASMRAAGTPEEKDLSAPVKLRAGPQHANSQSRLNVTMQRRQSAAKTAPLGATARMPTAKLPSYTVNEGSNESVPASISSAIAETCTLLDEATRRQELLLQRINRVTGTMRQNRS